MLLVRQHQVRHLCSFFQDCNPKFATAIADDMQDSSCSNGRKKKNTQMDDSHACAALSDKFAFHSMHLCSQVLEHLVSCVFTSALLMAIGQALPVGAGIVIAIE